MAGELVAQLDSAAFFRETSVGYDVRGFSVLAGNVRGVDFQKFRLSTVQQEYYQATAEIPGNLTITTGLTVKLRLVDDGTSSNDLGKVVKFGMTAFNMDAATFKTDLSAAGGAEQVATATLSSTAGIPVTLSIAIPNAQLASAGAGNMVLLRIRRLGYDAADTCDGRVIMLGGHVKNT